MNRISQCTFAALFGLASVPTNAEAGDETAVAPIEEITVTARYRNENLLDVPISITVLDSKAIENYGFDNAKDLSRSVANLQIKSSFSSVNPTIHLRGVGINDFSPNSASAIGVYVDQVNFASPAAQLFHMYDLEQVSVLRGPQGTLFGRNTTGGAILMTSRRPSGEFGASIEGTIADYNGSRFEGAVDVPIVKDVVSARVAFISQRDDGWARNALTDQHVNDRDDWGARAIVMATPTEAQEWTFKYYRNEVDATANQQQSRGLLTTTLFGAPIVDSAGNPALGDLLGYVDEQGSNTGQWDNVGPERLTLEGGSVIGKIDFDWATLTTITSYDTNDRFTRTDADASPNRLFHNDNKNSSEQWTQELRLGGSTDTLNWVAGAYFFDEHLDVHNVSEFLGFLWDLGAPTGLPGPSNFLDYWKQDNRAWALFGETDIGLTERLTATVGLRQTWEDKSIDAFNGVADEDRVLVFPVGTNDETKSWSETSGRALLRYQLRDSVMVWGGFSNGFKSGGFNGVGVLQPPFDPETLDSYEIGIKGLVLDGRLEVSTSAFYYDYTDLQVFTLTDVSGVPTVILDNAADANIKGGELELHFVPVMGLDTTLAIGYLDTEYENFIAATGEDFSGNEMVAAPRWNINGSASYTFDLGSIGSITPFVDFVFNDRQYFNTSNLSRLSEDGYTLWDARLVYRPPNPSWEAKLWVNNLTDEKYVVDIFDLSALGFDQISMGSPRRYGFTLKYTFKGG